MAAAITPEELLGRVSKRDVEALGDLYDRYAPPLLGMLGRMLRERRWAEEVLEEVFLRLWRQARTLNEARGSVPAWLVVNARYLALERLRAERQVTAAAKQANEQRLPQGGPGVRQAVNGRVGRITDRPGHAPSAPRFKSPAPKAWPAAWIPSPEEVARVDERLGLLQKVMNQLPKHQSEALELSVFGGYGEEEIARELDEPLGQVRSALCAAVTFLRHRRRAVVGSWAANI
jgi:RNA polymerase sigma factor (sigma-70 family)